MTGVRAALLLSVAAVFPASIADADTEDCVPFNYEGAVVSWVQTTVDGEPDPSFAPQIESLRVDANGDLVVLFEEARNNGYVLTLDTPQ